MADLILYVGIIISFWNATRGDLRGKNVTLLVIELACGITGKSEPGNVDKNTKYM
jgi:hypothetical protein